MTQVCYDLALSAHLPFYVSGTKSKHENTTVVSLVKMVVKIRKFIDYSAFS